MIDDNQANIDLLSTNQVEENDELLHKIAHEIEKLDFSQLNLSSLLDFVDEHSLLDKSTLLRLLNLKDHEDSIFDFLKLLEVQHTGPLISLHSLKTI